MAIKLRRKMNKKFLGVNMPKWLYDKCIDYSKKQHVSRALISRVALYRLACGGSPLSAEDDKIFTERFYFENE